MAAQTPGIADEAGVGPGVVTGLGPWAGGAARAAGLRPGQPPAPAAGAGAAHTGAAARRGPAPAITSAFDWVRTCDDEITLMDEMVPAFTAMHENGGHLPTECIFAFAHQFASGTGSSAYYNVPGYTI